MVCDFDKGGALTLEAKNNGNYENNRNLALIVLYGLTVPAVFLVILITNQIIKEGNFNFDLALANFINGTTSPVVIGFFTFMTDLGSKWGIGGVFLVSLVFIWWKKRDYLGMLVLVVAVLGGDTLNKWLKVFIGRERPTIDPSIYAEGFSFPSGHAMVGLIFYGFLAYYFGKETKSLKLKMSIFVLASLFIFLIGLSRIVLNVHYASDVLGGFLIGFIYLMGCIVIDRAGNQLKNSYVSKKNGVSF